MAKPDLQRIEIKQGWGDLRLAESALNQLKTLAANGRPTTSLTVLFSGTQGTGKTMAAGILANALGIPLYRIDLALIVSKYIGETEKNLSRLFDEAQSQNAVLFFDEADALFGKRTDVSGAHDRYANQEVAYLLERIESYPGLVILASNHKENIDAAFVRRVYSVIDFASPKTVERLPWWWRLLRWVRGLFQ